MIHKNISAQSITLFSEHIVRENHFCNILGTYFQITNLLQHIINTLTLENVWYMKICKSHHINVLIKSCKFNDKKYSKCVYFCVSAVCVLCCVVFITADYLYERCKSRRSVLCGGNC